MEETLKCVLLRGAGSCVEEVLVTWPWPWVRVDGRVDGTLNRRLLDGLLGAMLRVVMQTGSETKRKQTALQDNSTQKSPAPLAL